MPAESLTTLAAAIDELVGADAPTLADGDTVVALHAELERLTAVATRAMAAFDAGRSWEDDDARSAAAWVAAECRVPLEAARRRVRLGRRLRALPAVEAAWLAGEIGEAHADVLAKARVEVGAECLDAEAEAWLVEQARRCSWRDFRRVLAYWLQAVDPDGAEERAEAQHAARRLHLSESFEGTWFLDGVLDPLSGSVVAEGLRRIEEELFEDDWAEARSRVGDGVTVAHLARTPAQRRADALVAMARRAHAAPAGARAPEPLLSVFVGYETFAGRICELAGGTVVSPGSLLRWLDEARVERVVFDGPDRIAGLGHRRRLFTGAERRAVELRDRVCASAYCDLPAAQCEIDHLEPWSHGGPTVADNGRAVCSWHHRRRHRQGAPRGRSRPPPGG